MATDNDKNAPASGTGASQGDRSIGNGGKPIGDQDSWKGSFLPHDKQADVGDQPEATATPLALARAYLQRGWHPVPVPYGTKFPTDDEWQRRSITDANVHEFFHNGQQNIGIQLGPKSNNLADVDLDCSEAVDLAPFFLPQTKAIFGRKSKPTGHYLFYVKDPEPKAKISYLDEQSRMICELRLGGGGKGAQTMFPGSMHPDNERVEWKHDGPPAEAACATLAAACTKIAVGTLIMRAWPGQGGRHEGALRLGGFLARAGWDGDDIGHFVSIVAELAGDDEWRDRERAARDTFEAYSQGAQVAGLPKMMEHFGEEVAKTIAELIQYRETDTGELLERMNERYCVLPIAGKTRVLTWEENQERRVAVFYRFADFRALLDNKKVRRGGKTIGVGSWWLDHDERLQYAGLVFKPGAPSVVDDRLNLWRGWAIQPRQGSWRQLLRHIYRVLGNGDKASFRYILKWTAWALQHPDKQAEVALVFRGGRGTGRGLFARMLVEAFGQHGWHISSREHFIGRFNFHFMYCALLFVDEAYWPGDQKAEGVLKRMITEPDLTIEPKGIDLMQVPNALKIIIVSNEEWVVPAGIDERRFAAFNVSEAHKQDRKYFAPLYAEIESGGVAAMMHDLLAMNLKGWHPRNDVPQTRALQEQKLHSLSPENHWWLGLLQTGELPGPADTVQTPPTHSHPPREVIRNARLATATALLEHARKTVLQMRYCNEHLLGRILKQHGCDRNSDWRIQGRRAWQFPVLKEARAAWDAKMGAVTEWEEPDEWEHPDGLF